MNTYRKWCSANDSCLLEKIIPQDIILLPCKALPSFVSTSTILFQQSFQWLYISMSLLLWSSETTFLSHWFSHWIKYIFNMYSPYICMRVMFLMFWKVLYTRNNVRGFRLCQKDQGWAVVKTVNLMLQELLQKGPKRTGVNSECNKGSGDL